MRLLWIVGGVLLVEFGLIVLGLGLVAWDVARYGHEPGRR